VDFSAGENATMVQSFIRGLSRWPTADLATLLLAIKGILDARAEHHGKGGGVEAAIARRPRKKLPRDKVENA
jgi:hypothetical protein